MPSDTVEYVGPKWIELSHDCIHTDFEKCEDPGKRYVDFDVVLTTHGIGAEGKIEIFQAESIEEGEEPLRDGLRYTWPKLHASSSGANRVSCSAPGDFTFRASGFTFALHESVSEGQEIVFRFRQYLVPPFPLDYGWGVWVKHQRTDQDFEHVGSFETRVSATRLDGFELIVPTVVGVGRPFEVTVKAMEGRLGYETSYALNRVFEGDVLLTGPAIMERIHFGPEEEGRVRTTVRLDDKGLHRLRATAGLVSSESALIVVNETGRLLGDQQVFWGALQNHSSVGGHASGTTSKAYVYARDVADWDFIAMTEHDNLRTRFDVTQQVALADRFHEPGRFVTFPAFEARGEPESHRHVIFASGPEMLQSYAGSYQREDITELYRDLEDASCLIIPHHTAWARGYEEYPIDHLWSPKETGEAPSALRLLEVYSWHGPSDVCPPDLPFHGRPEQNRRCGRGSYYQEMLEQGFRLGVVAGTDEHLGLPGSYVAANYEGNLRYGLKGLTGVLAKASTRPALFEAFRARRTWGTTGARILLLLLARTAGETYLMGEEVPSTKAPVVLEIFAVATSAIDRVLLLSGTEVVSEWSGEGPLFIRRVSLPDGIATGQKVYNVKLYQSDGQMAWTSPIWLE
ncbi:MAG: DUF3604 domain-containing protein [Planctomycetota bacterium]